MDNDSKGGVCDESKGDKCWNEQSTPVSEKRKSQKTIKRHSLRQSA